MTAAAETPQAWRCTGCGRIANSTKAPAWHIRHGERCGPFAAAVVAPGGAVIAAPTAAVARGVSDSALRYRVTTLRNFATGCPRATVLGSKHTTGGIGTAGERGSLMHAAIAETLRTLWRSNEPRFESTEDVIAILREVHSRGPWIVTPADMFGVRHSDGTTAQRGIVQMIASFAEEHWTPSRFWVIEGAEMPFVGESRMTAEIICPDGEVRMLSGAPDLIIAAPPSGAIIIDHKQSMAKPTTPREPPPDGRPIEGIQYMTDPAGDYFQLIAYGYLAMRAFPSIQTVTLKEMSWRWMGNPRVATIRRDDLEHIEPYLATLMMQFDQAIREGECSEVAQPRAGSMCQKRCSVKRSCPIPREERGVGSVHDEASADAEAKRWHVVKALDPDQRAALKAIHAETGYCPKVSDDLVVRWKTKADGKGREFGVFPPLVPHDPAAALAEVGVTDAAFVASMEAELARRTGGTT